MTRRYEDWTHVRVNGDRHAAAPYLGEGRKLMGAVMEEAARNGLGVHVLHRQLEDGTVIVAEKHGDIPRITITPASPVAQQLRRTIDGFHLTWSGSALAYTPIIFTEPPEDEEGQVTGDWSSMFYNADAVGHSQTPEGRRAGSYVDVFGVRKGDGPQYRRLYHGSGIWRDQETDEAVTWLRGYTGYWPEHYRHPTACYSNVVSIYGHPVIAVEGGWKVMCAAKRGDWLYVLFAENLGFMEPPPVPPQPSYSGQVWCSQPYSNAAFIYALWRIPLAIEVQPDTGVETYRPVQDGAQMLWRGLLQRAYGAWSFNADCTECVTVQLPRVAVWSWVNEVEGDDWVASPVEQSSYPTVEAHRIELGIDHEPDLPVVTVSTTLAPTLIAEEDGVQLEIIEHTRTDAYSRNDYKLGDFTVPITEQVNDGGVQWYERRAMVHAHLPSKTLLLYRWRTELQPARYVSAGYELYVDGELVPVDYDPESTVESEFTAHSLDAFYASNHLRWMGLGFDNGETSWWRPMDAMTFLLGFGFTVQGLLPATGAAGAPNYGFQGCPNRGFSFLDTNLSAHSGAGGYIFGSVGGTPESQFWSASFPFALGYGANAGNYTDPAPSHAPIIGYLGSAATFGGNTVAAVGMQPFLAQIGTSLGGLAIENRVALFGTNGDCQTLIQAAIDGGGFGAWQRFSIGHTGKPRMHQRGGIHGS